jgi:hypothetical protein
MDPRFLDLDISWWCEFSTSRPGRALDRRLGVSMNWSVRRGKEKNSSLYLDSNSDLWVVQPVASRCTEKRNRKQNSLRLGLDSGDYLPIYNIFFFFV